MTRAAAAKSERQARDETVAAIVGAVASHRAQEEAEQTEAERRRAFLARSAKIWEDRCREIVSRGPGRTIVLSLLLVIGCGAWALETLDALNEPEDIVLLIHFLGEIEPRYWPEFLSPAAAPLLTLAMLLSALWASYLTAFTVVRRGAANCGFFERAAGGAMKGLILLALLGAALALIWLVLASAWRGEIWSYLLIGFLVFFFVGGGGSSQSEA